MPGQSIYHCKVSTLRRNLAMKYIKFYLHEVFVQTSFIKQETDGGREKFLRAMKYLVHSRLLRRDICSY